MIFDKFIGLFSSRRFYVAVAGVLLVVFTDVLGLDAEQSQAIIDILMAWIVGDSLYKTYIRGQVNSSAFIGKNNE